MIKQLYMKNFRRHEELNLSIGEGLSGIFGANYHGKTAILLAIAVAIGGPGWARGYRLARRGTDNFEIQLTFEASTGKSYRVMRSKSAGKLLEIGKEDKLLATGQTQVNIELGKVLGMPVHRWLELRFVRQKQAAQMFEAGSAQMNTLVEELTGVRTISLVIDRLLANGRAATAALEALRPNLLQEGQEEEMRRELQAHRSQLAEAIKLRDSAKGQVDLLSLKKPDLTMQLSDMRKALAVASAAAQERRQLEADLRSLVKQKAALAENLVEGDLAEVEAELAAERELLTEWNTWRSRMTAAQLQHDRAAAQLQKAQAVYDATALHPTEEAEAEILRCETWASRADAAVSASEAEGDKLDQRRDEVVSQQENGVCSACKRAFDNHDEAHVAELETLRASLEAQIQQQRAEHTLLVDELGQAETGLKAARKALKALQELNADVAPAMARLGAMKEAMQAAQADLDEVQQDAPDVTLTQADEEISMRQQRLRQLQEQVNALNVQATSKKAIDGQIREAEASLDRDEIQAAETDKQLEARQTKLDKVTQELAKLETALASASLEWKHATAQTVSCQSAITSAEASLEKAAELGRSVDRYEAVISNTSGLVKHLRDNRSRYLQNAWDLLLGRASAFAAAVTDGYITELRRTEDGAFVFVENDEEAWVTEASGAQSAVLGLSVQVALSETLPTTLDLFLADEPTADMDAEHSSAALLALSAVSKQAVVISHHRMDESICAEVMEL